MDVLNDIFLIIEVARWNESILNTTSVWQFVLTRPTRSEFLPHSLYMQRPVSNSFSPFVTKSLGVYSLLSSSFFNPPVFFLEQPPVSVDYVGHCRLSFTSYWRLRS